VRVTDFITGIYMISAPDLQKKNLFRPRYRQKYRSVVGSNCQKITAGPR
jgi:hypothetical protein